jgi:hypothetical protein
MDRNTNSGSHNVLLELKARFTPAVAQATLLHRFRVESQKENPPGPSRWLPHFRATQANLTVPRESILHCAAACRDTELIIVVNVGGSLYDQHERYSSALSFVQWGSALKFDDFDAFRGARASTEVSSLASPAASLTTVWSIKPPSAPTRRLRGEGIDRGVCAICKVCC